MLPVYYSKMSYKISYFTFKGLGEPVRFMLAYGNVDFIDNRVEEGDWAALKPSENFLKFNFN